GIYYLPTSYILHDTGLSQRELDTLWDTLSRLVLSEIDRARDIVWVVKMFRYQGKGLKNAISASHHLKTLHKSHLCQRFAEMYPEVLAVENGYRIDTPP